MFVIFLIEVWLLLPGKSHGRRSLVGCSPWGRWESDTTEWLCFHFSLSCIGEGNGNPLQCSCLENPRDGGAWWAAVYGVTQSRKRLKRLSSSMIAVQNFLQKLTEFSVKHQHESAVGIHMFPATWTSLPSPPTSHSSRLIQSPPFWVSWDIQQIPIGCLFYIW